MIEKKQFFFNMTATEYRKMMGMPVEGAASVKPQKENKFHAKKTELDGMTFDSKKESQQYLKLKRLETAGIIQNLQRQTAIDYFIKGKKIFTYKPDFEYDDEKGHHYVDVKSSFTEKDRVFRLKKKIIEAEYGIVIEILK